MLKGLKNAWCDLKKGRPGHRFQRRAEKNQRQQSNLPWVRRFLEPIIGTMLILAGIILCFIPGPGVPLIALGATMLAAHSRKVARFMDWVELKLRAIITWAGRRWRHASGA